MTAQPSTRRHDRPTWRVCPPEGGKVLFPTQQAALDAIDRMLGQGCAEAAWLNPYPCSHGQGFHVGHVRLP